MIKQFKTTIISNRIFILFLALASLLSFTPLKPLALIICVLGWAHIWPFGKLANSFVLRTALGFFLSSAILQLVGIVYWALDVHLTVIHAVVIQVVGILLLLFTLHKNTSTKFVTGSDIAALAVAIFVLIFIGAGTFARPLTPHLLKATTSAFDDTIHTSLSLTVYDNQGYVYGKKDAVIGRVMYDALVAYPQGWYLSNGVWWHSFSDNINPTKSVRNVALFYLASKLLWFTAIAFIFCRLVLSLIEYVGSKLNLLAYVGAALLTLLVEVLLLFGIYKFGFSSFFPVIVFNLALIFVLFGNKEKPGLGFGLLTGLIFCGASSMSWLLAAPAAYATVAFAFFDSFDYKMRRIIAWIKMRWKLFLTASLVTLLGLSQLAIQLLYSVNTNLINTDGGIWPINTGLFVVLLTLLLVTVAVPTGKNFKPLFFLIAPAALLTALIYTYQYASVGRATYYSTKVAYVPYILLLLFGAFLVLYLIGRFSREQHFLFGLVAIVSFVSIIPYGLNANLSILSTVSGRTHKLSLYSAQQITSVVDKGDLHGNVIVYKNLDYEEDLLTTNYLTMLGRSQSECQRMMIWFILSKQYGEIEKQIPVCANETTGSKYYVISSSINYDRLSKLYASQPKIDVILSN